MVGFASDVLFEDDVAVTVSVNASESVAYEGDVLFEDEVVIKDDVTVTVSVNVFEEEVASASTFQGMNIMVTHNRRVMPYGFINKKG